MLVAGAVMRTDREDGTSLVEVLVATGILVVSMTTLAQLFPIAVHETIASRDATVEALLAEQKIEQLRALTWGFDPQGAHVSDPGLNQSPAGSLAADTPGFVDYVDQFGRSLEADVNQPADAVYTRRWSIQPLPANPDNALVIQVLVMRTSARGAVDAPGQSGKVRLLTVKARKAR
jgi:hypothetical protein